MQGATKRHSARLLISLLPLSGMTSYQSSVELSVVYFAKAATAHEMINEDEAPHFCCFEWRQGAPAYRRCLMNIKHLWLLLGILILTVTCSPEDSSPSLSLGTSDYHIGSEGGAWYLDINASGTWSIDAPSASWVSIGRLSGEGQASIPMIIIPNTIQMPRQCSFSVWCGKRSKDVFILQEGAENGGGLSEKSIQPPQNFRGNSFDYYQNGKYYASLSWDKVDNAIGYYLYYSQYSTSGFQKVGGSISELTKLTDAHNGNNYYYVTAYSSIEESSPSEIIRIYVESSASAGDWDNQGSGHEETKPDVPTGVSASNQGSSSSPVVRITWNAVSGATAYRVYRSSSASGGYSKIGDVTSTYFNDSSPMSGYNYYKVTAVNSHGESGYSSYAVFHWNSSGGGGNEGSKPSAPTGLTATNQGNNVSPIVHLSWNAVSNATGYRVYRSSSASSGYSQLSSTSSTSYNDTYPSSGYNYYKVTAYNSAGESGYSSYTVFNWDTSSSAKPATPTVTASGSSSSISVSWTCTTGNGFGTPKQYKVYKQDPYTSQWSELTTTTSRSYSDRNVHPGKNWYAVEAINDAGSSLGYGSSNEISLNAPTSFSASASGSYIKCSWGKVPAATGYQIFSSDKAGGSYYILQQIDDVNTTSAEIYYPASSGTTVYLKIRAVWIVGTNTPVYSNYSSYKSVRF